MSSILDALERASQEMMPGKTDILPESMPVFDENKTVFRRLLLLLGLLISIIAAFWFLFDDGASKPETPANAEPMTNSVIRPQATPPAERDGGTETASRSKPTVPKDELTAERIRSSSRPNQRPLISEAIVSEKQQRMIPKMSESVPEEQASGQLPIPPIVERKIPAPLPAPIAEEVTYAEQSEQVATMPEVDEDRIASVESTVNDAADAAQTDQQQIPLIWELDQGLREELEQLRTTIHVYHEIPSERFVIINMRRYSEGDTFDVNGYRLHTIDRDGIVIDYGNGLVRLLREKY
ncbi:MAG: general secretion pathway protein GspB [Candidatus Thiodiazotropha endolucinida]|nr:general secretion pathway protein GspB [Candidatus Thiodiazotropha taylori]MCG8097036.1 general secretion pathway protein GspB [Candidatus Thiodiazotropha endolucinida]MCG8060450.1 general secretion pathway protein GspB [Candidatus Thiodiazotropha taylori]MCG8065178.1 general secretion pathway protein GspB [Candidatus Thiodiazotropha taylori]MCW4331270.1 general secretion pathway protein GspB [Candidatus Thiodiazotropha endolucinida]